MRVRPLLVLTALALSIAACGSSSTPKAGALAQVSGSYGDKPTLTFATASPPSALQSSVLRKGSGAVVAKGDLLVADYLGQVVGGKVFDNSYDRKAPSGFVVGEGKLIPAWDKVLVGAKVGSRVLMSVPPADGYGTSGNTQAGIKGTDTLEFVVDLIATFGPKAAGDPKAEPTGAQTPGITVSGALGSAPTVKVASSTKAPASATLVVLAKGSGPAVTDGLLVLQYVATRFTGEAAGSTYDSAPAAFPLGATGSGSSQNPFDQVRGVPLGSRVLLEVPASAGQAALAVVIDLVAQPKTAAQTVPTS